MDSEECSNESFASATSSVDPFFSKSIVNEEKTLHSEVRKQNTALRRKYKEEENQKEKKDKAIKALHYLLGTSEKYSKFFTAKLIHEAELKKRGAAGAKGVADILRGELEKIKSGKEVSSTGGVNLLSQAGDLPLKYFENGTLRPYQKEGLAWLKILFENGVNGILADEMGLGKTVQVIALICHLIEEGVPGPYLILAPLSTIPNWMFEMQRFAPKIPYVVFHGTLNERKLLYEKILTKTPVGKVRTAPVVITSYNMVLRETPFLSSLKWKYIIIDEGHRIKNSQCVLCGCLKKLTSVNRLILTGTPLQNNLLELWALLNFLMPQFFSNPETFDSLFVLEDFTANKKHLENEQTEHIISTIHRVLEPFMLRRLKSEVLPDVVPKKDVLVYCPLSDLQISLYKSVLDRNIERLKGLLDEASASGVDQPRKKRRSAQKCRSVMFQDPEDIYKAVVGTSCSVKKKESNFIHTLTMASPWSMLKKIVNHPYLVQFPLVPGKKQLLVDENLINHSGKMIVLDAMLKKLRQQGHKVLIFSTMTTILDMIEELMIFRGLKYCRLDGCLKLDQRSVNISQFNKDKNTLAFLISTRAGGLGLNLTSADTVIFFDRDWNPQVDIQAQDRCHRIGQTKPVMVYSLISKNTIDENIIAISDAKRKLEKAVIRKGKFCFMPSSEVKLTDLEELRAILESYDHSQVQFSAEKLNEILDRSELTEMMKSAASAKEE